MTCLTSRTNLEIARLRDGAWTTAFDAIAIEEPLEIRLSSVTGRQRDESTLSITMRTPGSDPALAAGFLFGEGIVSQPGDIDSIDRVPPPDGQDLGNILLVRLRPGLEVDFPAIQRNFTTTSACGVCGKASLDSLIDQGCRPLRGEAKVRTSTLESLPAKLRQAQEGFDATGGVHAVGLFSLDGELLSLAEDVGRHNAFDKLVGAAFLAGELDQLQQSLILLSGRASFELLQKALRARIPIVAAVGAPSSLAVEVATTFGITLAGFLKPTGFNVYTGRERIDG
jgi:FdhD protein